MNFRFQLLAWGAAFILVLSGCQAPPPDPADIRAGDARDAVLDQYGEPALRKTLTKREQHVWGPIEDFWADVPMDATVEIWTYPAEGGDVELYFLNDSPTVDGTAFAPEGVVYEAVR